MLLYWGKKQRKNIFHNFFSHFANNPIPLQWKIEKCILSLPSSGVWFKKKYIYCQVQFGNSFHKSKSVWSDSKPGGKFGLATAWSQKAKQNSVFEWAQHMWLQKFFTLKRANRNAIKRYGVHKLKRWHTNMNTKGCFERDHWKYQNKHIERIAIIYETIFLQNIHRFVYFGWPLFGTGSFICMRMRYTIIPQPTHSERGRKIKRGRFHLHLAIHDKTITPLYPLTSRSRMIRRKLQIYSLFVTTTKTSKRGKNHRFEEIVCINWFERKLLHREIRLCERQPWRQQWIANPSNQNEKCKWNREIDIKRFCPYFLWRLQ